MVERAASGELAAVSVRRPLGRTGLSVAPLVLGTAPMSSFFWGTPVEQGVDTAVAALQAGVRQFDTAPLYGLGEAEARLGEALAQTGIDDVLIATKVGRTLVDDGAATEAVFDFSADAVHRQLEASLARLGRDRVDIVHVHDPDDHLAAALDGAFPALVRWREEGVISAVSVGANSVATVASAIRGADLDVAMVAGRLTLLDRSAVSALLPLCRQRGIPLLAAAVFNSGVLARPHDGAWLDYAPVLPEELERVRALATVCEEAGSSLRAAALQFPLRYPEVLAVVVGMSSPAEVESNLADLSAPIDGAVWSALDAIAVAEASGS